MRVDDFNDFNDFIKGKPDKSGNYVIKNKYGMIGTDDYTTSGGGHWWNESNDGVLYILRHHLGVLANKILPLRIGVREAPLRNVLVVNIITEKSISVCTENQMFQMI